MEFIAEILLEILKVLLQAGEKVLMQMVVEVFGEVIGHGMRETFRRPKSLEPWLAVIEYLA